MRLSTRFCRLSSCALVFAFHNSYTSLASTHKHHLITIFHSNTLFFPTQTYPHILSYSSLIRLLTTNQYLLLTHILSCSDTLYSHHYLPLISSSHSRFSHTRPFFLPPTHTSPLHHLLLMASPTTACPSSFPVFP